MSEGSSSLVFWPGMLIENKAGRIYNEHGDLGLYKVVQVCDTDGYPVVDPSQHDSEKLLYGCTFGYLNRKHWFLQSGLAFQGSKHWHGVLFSGYNKIVFTGGPERGKQVEKGTYSCCRYLSNTITLKDGSIHPACEVLDEDEISDHDLTLALKALHEQFSSTDGTHINPKLRFVPGMYVRTIDTPDVKVPPYFIVLVLDLDGNPVQNPFEHDPDKLLYGCTGGFFFIGSKNWKGGKIGNDRKTIFTGGRYAGKKVQTEDVRCWHHDKNTVHLKKDWTSYPASTIHEVTDDQCEIVKQALKRLLPLTDEMIIQLRDVNPGNTSEAASC